MMMSRPNTLEEKKDLHFGGVGARATDAAAFPAITPLPNNWARTGRNLAATAESWVGRNPWAALALIGAAGIALGLLIARHD